MPEWPNGYGLGPYGLVPTGVRNSRRTKVLLSAYILLSQCGDTTFINKLFFFLKMYSHFLDKNVKAREVFWHYFAVLGGATRIVVECHNRGR